MAYNVLQWSDARVPVLTFDARVSTASRNQLWSSRLELTFLVSQGDGVIEREGYLWATHTLGELVGSLLLAAQHTGEPVRVSGYETAFGFKVVWAEKVEQAKEHTA